MESRFKLNGKEALIQQLKGIGVEVEDGVSKMLVEVGEEAKTNLRAAIPDGGGSVSNPGEAPHSQTGTLRSQIYAKLDKKILGQEILLTVGLTKKGFYGFILEQGASKYSKGFKRKHSAGEGAKNSAKFGQRLLPRPWFWGTIEKFWVKAPAVVESYINKVLGKYAN